MTWIVPSGIRSDFAAASGCSTLPCPSAPNNSESTAVLRCYASGTLTPRPSSWHGWKTRPWSRALFGAAICGTSTPSLFAAWWTSSLRGSRASRTASRASSKATAIDAATAKTEADPSRNFCGSWPSVDPPWCSSKTCLPGFAMDGFDLSERNYREWVTRSKTRSLSLRNRLARATSGNECSSWPTAQASDGEKMSHPRRDGDRTLTSEAKTWSTPKANEYTSQSDAAVAKGFKPTLHDQSRQWPTPNVPTRGPELSKAHRPDAGGIDLQSTAMIWQTPSARDQEGSGFRGGDRSDEAKLGGQAKLWGTPAAHQRSHSQREVDHGIQLANQACSHTAPAPTGEQSQNTSGRRLNPAFVSWLMGAPWWWMRAEPINFGAREMQSYRCALRSRLSSLCGG